LFLWFFGFPFGDHRFEFAGEGFQPADGRAQARREQGVLGRVLGDGCDQEVEERSESLGQGGGELVPCDCHS
jgi:hypothetical protein